MKISILADRSQKIHSTSWTNAWEEYCKENKLKYEIINPYQIGIIEKLMASDIILWHFSNYKYEDMLMARDILYTMETTGKKVFPSFRDAWHFDDKLAGTYFLERVNAPIPASFYYYSPESVEKAIQQNDLKFPIVAKLRNGSGSHNVQLINNSSELINYSKKMFGPGINSAPSLLFKTTSNVKTAQNFKTFIARAKRIPEFLRSMSNAQKFNRERGYVFLQEFIENNGYDLKIVVIGDKLSFICRSVRKGDFRASGGGSLFFDKKLVPDNVIKSAFETSDQLGFQCMGYDYVVDKNTNEGKIVEISYGFSHQALLQAEGYFDRQGNWISKPLNAPIEILKNLIIKTI